MNEYYQFYYDSPIGVIEIAGTQDVVCSILYCDQPIERYANSVDTPKVLLDCTAQLKEYFAGERREFSIPYQLQGTLFQEKVLGNAHIHPICPNQHIQRISQYDREQSGNQGSRKCKWKKSFKYCRSLSSDHWDEWGINRLWGRLVEKGMAPSTRENP